MPSFPSVVVVIGTGGTIAGTGGSAAAHTGYRAGALTAETLVGGVAALRGQAVEVESLAQMDSANMDHATWVRLGQRVHHHLKRPEVAGIVITHGTDTLEETGVFLHLTVAAHKPVVLTAAMRPSTAPSPDGPQNLVDAVQVARDSRARGVLLVYGGRVLAAHEARKVHGYNLEAFSSGDAPPLALMQDGALQVFRPWPEAEASCAAVLDSDPATWPVVDIVTSHAGARAATLQALVQAGARGLVIAGTGNGSVHTELLAAAHAAVAQGVVVRRASRCVTGGVVGERYEGLLSAGAATPAQARVALLLELVLQQAHLAGKQPAKRAATQPALKAPAKSVSKGKGRGIRRSTP